MKRSYCFFYRAIFIFIALSLSLGAPAAFAKGGNDVPVAGAEMEPPLPQFTAGGHVIGFAPTQVALASLDHALRIEFVGTAGATPIVSSAKAPESRGGLLTRDAQPLGAVVYPDLWRGVSVEYRPDAAGILKSEYTLAPGADAAQIRLRYNVPVALQDDGSLQFSFGRGYISESAPIAWQEIDGRRVFVPVAFRLQKSEVGFQLGAYDPRHPLTIDPTYAWHTFYGSSAGGDTSFGIAIDSGGNVYVTGSSAVTWQGDGGVNPLHAHSGSQDVFVLKLNSAGAYQWHTFYGSLSNDTSYSIAVDGSGNVYVTGDSAVTWQGDGGVNPLHAHSGSQDILVLKLNSAGAYQWHTFYGSSNIDYGGGIAVGSGGSVYVTGSSNATWQGNGGANPLHAHSGGGGYDCFALKLTSAGAYQWHTFYGATFSAPWGDDYGNAIALDSGGNVYIAGSTGTFSWQGSGGANPLHAHSTGYDMFALKLNSAGVYQWHTFYGAVFSAVKPSGIIVDGSGNIYITGNSDSTWMGAGGVSPLHARSPGANWDIFALKLNSAGAYQWHTFYGSSSNDFGGDVAVDSGGNVYVTGHSGAAWLGDLGVNPLHAHSGGDDILVMQLNSAGAYQWHTFYGSLNTDYGKSIAVGSGGSVYVTGDSSVTWQGDGGVNPLHAHSGYGISDVFVLALVPNVPPSLQSFTRFNPLTSPASANTLVFRATFSEDVKNVDAADFQINASPASTATIASVMPVSASVYEITVSGGNLAEYNGVIGLDLAAAQNISDLTNLSLPTVEPVVDETYTVENLLVASHSLQATYIEPGPSSFTIAFSRSAYDPGGNSDPDDVTNPANYLLIEKGANGNADTLSCLGGVSGDDAQQTVTAVAYNAATYTADVALAGALPAGQYRLLLCATTSIVSPLGMPLNEGIDYIVDFNVQNITQLKLPDTGFPMGRATQLGPQPAEKAYARSGLRLEIPKLGVNVNIVGVPLINGGWDVSWLGAQAGWLQGSAFPTWNGNSVLTGHVWNADNTPGVFRSLDSLQWGDKAIVHAGGAQYVYEVRSARRINSSALLTAFQHRETPWLSLLTCRAWNEQSGMYRYRFLVQAVLTEIK